MKAFICISLLFMSTIAASAAEPAAFSDVAEQTVSHGFRATAVYLDDAGQPFGARFTHEKTGFTLDLIQVQSVPQAFTWVNTFPVSDKGEPHTQEHLLVGKGNVGRALAASESMTLSVSSAFTMQWRTCYDFNTNAGLGVFYDGFRMQLNALLHPDYTDEEIGREVRNFGIAENPATHELRLEEKGTVYNEMVSSMAKPDWLLFSQELLDVYGPGHPLSYSSGGLPAAIRLMKPQDIRAFHDRHYFLANMGSVVSLPKGDTVAAQLTRFDDILNALQPGEVTLSSSSARPDRTAEPGTVVERPDSAGRAVRALQAESAADLPAPKPAAPGSIQIVDFPYENDHQPSYVGLAWPANRKLSNRDSLLFELFFNSFAGDTTTNLYRLFVNGSTRKIETGASGVNAYVSEDQGYPVFIGFEEVAAANLTEGKVKEMRSVVMAELARIAALPDGSPELSEFNAQVRSRLVEQRRDLAKLVNSPPGFGARGTGSTWMDQLYRLNREPGFRKFVTEKPDIEAIHQMLSGTKNIWRELLPQWHITGTEPFGIAARPSPALLAKEQQDRVDRATAEVKRLAAIYKLDNDQDVIKRYQADYDAQTKKLDELARTAGNRKFLDNPPMTLDDQLEYTESKVDGKIPLVASYFDNMTSATTSVAFNLASVPEADLPLVSLLPELLSESGVIENGKPVSYEQMQQMLRREILNLDAGFSSNTRTDRVELVVSGAGNDLTESRRAIEWMRLILSHPDWRVENLPRIRDLVEQYVGRVRTTMQGPEEYWVMNPVYAYWKQKNPLYLTTSSFLTREWNADRLRWMLKDVGDRAAVAAELQALSNSPGHDRATILKAIAALKNKDLADDLTQLVADLPDESLTADTSYLCRQLRADILVTPSKALERLDTLRREILSAGNARMWAVGSHASLDQLKAPMATLAGDLRDASPARAVYGSAARIDARLREHQGSDATPRFVGLYDPNLTGGVMASIIPFTSYDDPSRDKQLDYLASRLFAGYGEHGVFTKTISAGLAYSNGLRGTLHDGWAGYYAERMPEIPQTLHFAIDVIKKGPRDPQFGEYAIALAFQPSNAASSYEDRAEAIANDLADGITPAKVRKFRENLLALRREPGLADELFRRMDTVYSKILPGYGGRAKDVPGAVYFIIGNEKQFKAMDADVQVREDEHVYKLYPRDYWLVGGNRP
jgi:Zn-dependent M16 (insulinase) family peptidase